MYWELWDIKSKNLVETFDTEDEAIQGVRDLLSVNRPDLVDDLVLGAMYDEDEPEESPLPPTLSGESLSARLAEAVPVDDATHAVHEKIRRWLTEEGWHVRDVDDPQASFNVMVTLHDGEAVNIFQYHDHLDHLTIHRHVLLDDKSRSYFSQLPVRVQDNTGRKIIQDLTIMGLEVLDLESHPLEMRYGLFIYFDGLTKDALVQRIHLVLRANLLSLRTIFYALADAALELNAAGVETVNDDREETAEHRAKAYPPNVIEFPGIQAGEGGELKRVAI